MNPDLIETREEALALVDADLITIQDYILLAGFKGWSLDGTTSIQAAPMQAEPATGSSDPRFEIVSFSARRQAAPRASVPEPPRHEKGRVLSFSRPLRLEHCR
ncbi:hypothetical protein [Methylorubrum zatmanii]|uniref:Uncharacterized protein n=1 Tax=Methylorubrum zatmanii TaxID=29429 RepID=A0ABW1WRX0_9HYPH|nr:hypothetical protein [Methylorubrum zatmanii]MBD8906718.1 hypothetical protein [Methylorubrum zatmanii]